MGTNPFRLRTLGGASLESRDGIPLQGFAAQRKALALLAILAVAGNRGLSRDKILALLWPESETDAARNALYNLVFRVRRTLGSEAIVGNAELRLDPSIVMSDVSEFDEALRAGALEHAVQLYCGPFLDGFFLRDAPEFERWSADERARLARIHLDVLERLAIAATGSSDRIAAVNWWRQRTEVEPLSARAAVGYIDALVQAGNREAALSFASVHSALVRNELGTEPDPILLRRVDQLRANGHTNDVRPFTARQSLQQQPAATHAAQVHQELGRPVMGAWKNPRWIAAVVAVFGCALLGVVITARHAATSTVDSRRVVVAAFDNQTGDSVLDVFGRIAANGITEQLARTGFVKVVDPATALASSRRIRDSVSRLTSSPALQVLSRATHAGLVVTGSYFRDGDDLVVEARVSDAPREQVLAAIEPVRGSIANPGAVLDAVRQRVVGALAVHLDERLAAILPQGLSPTYEAYASFISGLEIFTTGHLPDAAPYFARAYALDTTFVEPLIWEAFAVGNLVKRDSIVRVLENHRTSLSQIDRDALDYHEATVSGSLEERLVAARHAAELAPGSHWTHNIATVLAALGRTNEAIDVWATIDRQHGWVATWPGFWMGYIQALHVAQRHREELEIAREAHKALPANFTLQQYEAIALAMNQKWQEFDEAMRTIEERTNATWELRTIAAELHLHGEDARSRWVHDQSVRRYAELALAGSHDAVFRADHAITLCAAGRWSECGPLIDSLREEQPPNRQWTTLAALVQARTGDRARAIAVMDSLVNSATGPSADGQLADAARIAAVLGQRRRAIELLHRAHGHPNKAWRHYAWNSFDFDSLTGNLEFERLTGGR